MFDIEIDSEDPDEIVRTVQLIEPTFGGINLEDIRAPECFEIETRLIETLDIPVFHDDQHGTAIISGAALLNARPAHRAARSRRSRWWSRARARRASRARELYRDLGVRAREHPAVRHARA